MQLVAHPAVTAGFALAGAGLFAITPVSFPLPTVRIAAVQLASSFDPITPWEDVLTSASANATALFAEWSAAPFPMLQQIVANQIGYLGELPDLQTIYGQISDHLQAAGHAAVAPDLGLLNTAHLDALSGDIAGGIIPANLLSPELFQSPILSAASGVLIGALGPVVSPVLALDNSLQEIATALTGSNPDFVAALNDLVNIPAAVTGAFLDGYGSVDLTPLLSDLGVSSLLPTGSTLNSLDVAMGGLFSPGGSLFDALGFNLSFSPPIPTEPADGFELAGSAVGPLGSLIDLSQAIAEAIGWNGVGNPLDMLSSFF